MPYSSTNEIPDSVKKYSIKKQRQWFHVFNSTYKKIIKERESTTEAEKRAFMAANSTLKRNVTKERMQSDMFAYHVDMFLNNLEG